MPAESRKESATERAFDYDRTVALSDGVFAIALTLLVLTIDFPDLHGGAVGQLAKELEHRISQVLSYALSFAVLGFLWLRHHAFFRELRGIDLRLATLNLVYLALIAFLPYPTRLLGTYGSESVSVIVYAATIVLISTTAVAMRLYAVQRDLAPPSAAEDWRKQLAAPAIFAISIPIALVVSASAAEWSWLLLLAVRPALRGSG